MSRISNRERITKILNDYDVVIFMARKAICLFKSFIINKMIDVPSTCTILSSRTLTYNVFEQFIGKRVAVVDDVVIKGNSLVNVLDILSTEGIFADIHIAACREEFIKNIQFKYGKYLKQPFVILSEANTYQLSQYITEFIEASMCPYNIDQPIYNLEFDSNEELIHFLSQNKCTDITSTNQKRYGIFSYAIHLTNGIKDVFKNYICDLSSISIIKIRIMFKKDARELVAIPFVILSELTYDEVNNNFNIVKTPELDSFVHNPNEKIRNENKLKCIHYFYSAYLMNIFLESIDNKKTINLKRLDSNDNYSFACNILSLSRYDNIQSNSNINTFRFQSYPQGNRFKFCIYLGLTYDYIYSNEVISKSYKDAEEYIINYEIIVLKNLVAYISSNLDDFDELIFSNVIDVLIDRGILIPSIIHGTKNSIIRAYKCGEVYKLTAEHFRLFAFMLGVYSNKIDRALFKTELEKLCVLFFREIDRRDYFRQLDEVDDIGADEYSICYSKFGPRISTSKPVYSANEDSVLAAKLMNDKYMKIIYKTEGNNIRNPRYEIHCHEYNTPNNSAWKISAMRFAIRYSTINNAFDSHMFDDTKNMYIKTYIDFLTLLSIGLNKRDQLISLLAELYLFISINTKADIIQVLKNSNRIIDGLASGMWKYMCFAKQTHPLSDMYTLMLEKDGPLATAIDLDINPDFNKNPQIPNLVHQCGELIYEVAYTLYYFGIKYGIRYTFDLARDKKREFYYKPMRELRKSIQMQIEGMSSKDEDLAILLNLKKQAIDHMTTYETTVERGRLVMPTVQTKNRKRFSIAVSFAGEYRDTHVEPIMEILSNSGIPKDKLLYDMYHEAEFAMPNLDLHLYKLYSEEADLIVVFLSKEYNTKSWTGVEYRSIRKLLNTRINDSSIMFIRLDKSEIDGLSYITDGAVDASRHNPDSLAKLILMRYTQLNNYL